VHHRITTCPAASNRSRRPSISCHDNTHEQAVEERIAEHFKKQLHRSRSRSAPKWVSWRVISMLIACGRLGGRTDLCPYGLVGGDTHRNQVNAGFNVSECSAGLETTTEGKKLLRYAVLEMCNNA